MNRPLFEALFLEKMAVSITIGLIVMVAALNIVASLVLLVMEKTPDIAILKTMGATSRSVMYIFMLQGLIIGSIGTAIGAVVGGAIGKEAHDSDLSTAAGAAAGAFIGRRLQRRAQENHEAERTTTQTVHRCGPPGSRPVN
jgi:ABC-type antimicrobial peptide transport system permease subunit